MLVRLMTIVHTKSMRTETKDLTSEVKLQQERGERCSLLGLDCIGLLRGALIPHTRFGFLTFTPRVLWRVSVNSSIILICQSLCMLKMEKNVLAKTTSFNNNTQSSQHLVCFGIENYDCLPVLPYFVIVWNDKETVTVINLQWAEKKAIRLQILGFLHQHGWITADSLVWQFPINPPVGVVETHWTVQTKQVSAVMLRICKARRSTQPSASNINNVEHFLNEHIFSFPFFFNVLDNCVNQGFTLRFPL